MIWLLTSDWQAKHSNLDACRRAHEQELEIIQKHKVKGHIDLGDLKDDFNPVDVGVMEFQLQRSAAIKEAVEEDVKVLGNHDMIGQYAHEKNWFSLFDPVSRHIIRKPKILELKSCSLYCIPFRRNPKMILEAADAFNRKRTSKTPTILLGHFSVNGARFSRVTPKREANKITVHALHSEAYTRAFFGHIHLRQRIGKNGTYVGNPFATDNGEIDQQKGFILYDDETDTTKFILSKVPGIFSWNFIRKHKSLSPMDGSRIRAVVDCSLRDDYHKELESLSSKIEKRYPHCIAYVTPRFRVEESKQTVEINPNASDLDKIRTYIYATVPIELKKKKEALVQYIGAQISNAKELYGLGASDHLSFDSVEASNVLSFANVSYSYRNQGLVLVKGENKDWTGHSNGAGKTSFLALIPIAWYGKTFKGEKNDEWANDKNKERAWVKLTVSNDSSQKIETFRQRRRMKLKLKIDGEDKSTGRRHTGKNETQGRIEEKVGYTFETLANAVYIDQSLTNAFLSGTPADRAKIIHKFQNMDRFKLARDRISKELSKLKTQQVEVETRQEALTDSISQLEKDIRDSRTQEARKIKEAVRALCELEKAYEHEEAACSGLLARLDRSTIEKQIAPLESRLKELEKKTYYAASVAEAKQSQIVDLEKWDKDSDCPVCFRKLTEDARSLLLKRFRKEVKLLNKNEYIAKRKEACVAKKLRRLETKLTEVEKLLDRAEERRDNAKREYTAANRNLQSIREDQSKYRNSTEFATRRRHNIHEHKRTKRILRNIADDKEFLAYAMDTVSRDGLPSFLNKLLCPTLNKAAEYYSSLFIDKEIQVLFDIQGGHITPSVINIHGGTTIKSQSTGEKAWAGIIASFALREIAHPTNLLILDEPGHGLDSESAKTFGQRLSKLKEKFETILLVTHNEHIIGSVNNDKTLTIVKQNNVSKIRTTK